MQSSNEPVAVHQSPTLSPASDRIALLVVSGVSTAILLTEFLQTRLLSFMYWNHMVYFIITVAMLGFGIAGTLQALGRQTWAGRHLTVRRAGLGFGLSVLAFVGIEPYLLFETRSGLTGWNSLVLLFSTYLIAVLPYFCGGWILGAVFRERSASIQRLYFADLAGASLGVVLFILIITPLGIVRSFVVAALVGTLPLLFLSDDRVVSDSDDSGSRNSTGWFRLGITVFLISAASLFWNAESLETHLAVEPSKSISRFSELLSTTGDKAVSELLAWDSISRVDVRASHRQPLLKNVFIDGDAVQPLVVGTPAYPPPFRPDQEPMLEKNTAFLFGKASPSVLIIGSGGGLDVVNSLRAGASRIDAVELNGIICRLCQSDYGGAMNALFQRPGVSLYHDEGRSFLRRSSSTYDVILLNSIDTFSAMNSGAYVLSENFLYTEEAFSDYLNHLTPDGMLAISRWYGIPESMRLFILIVEALYQAGIERADDHLLAHLRLNQEKNTDGKTTAWLTILLKKSPFTPAEKQLYQDHVHRHGGQLLFPGNASDPTNLFPWYAGVRAREEHHAYFQQLPVDVSPVTDNSPFFFNCGKWGYFFPTCTSSSRVFCKKGTCHR